MNRYTVEDGSKIYKRFTNDFTITDTWTDEEWDVHFAWLGKDMRKTGTWDYAPLAEMNDCEGQEYDKFRIKLHQDQKFVEQQLTMLRRYHIWWEKHKTEIRTKDELRTHFDNDSMVCRDVDNTKYIFSGNPLDKELNDSYPIWLLNKDIFFLLKKYKKTHSLLSRILWRLQINLSAEDKQLWRAHKNSEKLLRQWLSEDEFRWLVHQGELTIKHDDETYIIHKRSTANVIHIDKNNHKSKYCLIAKSPDAPIGDELLAKILMIKTEPERFKKIAIKTRG